MFSGTSIAHWITSNVFVVLVLVVAAVILTFAFGGRIRQAATAVGIVLIAFFLVGASAHADAMGCWLYNLITLGNTSKC